MQGSDIVKIKVYNARGLTVYSTEKRQIGEDKSENPGFVSARNGKVASELTHRDQFSSFEKTTSNLDLVSSYIPISEDGRVIAVFEVYQNVGGFIKRINHSLFQVWSVMTLVLGALYLLLQLFVHHAQKVLSRQEAQLEAANCDLDKRVAERTADLQRSELRLRNTLDSARDAIVTLDIEGRIVGWNPAAEALFGYSASEVTGQSVAKIIVERYLSLAMESFRLIAQESLGKANISLTELGGLRKDGSEFVFDGSVSSWGTPDGRFYTAIIDDIGERQRQDRRIRELLQEQRIIFDNVQVGILLVQNRNIVKCNQRIASMFGFANPQDVEGKSTEIFYPSPEQFEAVGATGYAQLAEKGYADFEVELRRQDGAPLWVIQSGRPLNPASVLDSPSIWVYTDITERMRADAELRIAATAFESQEGSQPPRILSSGRHDSGYYAAMWESIHHNGCWQGEIWDRRKNGQVYPKWLSISAVKNTDGVVTHYVGTHTDITARKLAEDKIRHLAFFDQLTGLPNRTLLLDRLKQSMAAGERSQTYSAVLFIDLDDLRRALQEEQFELYYQAQVDGTDAHIAGVEALIRWNHPTQGRVGPDTFIPRAEENGLILPIGLWVLNTACKQLALWASNPGLAYLTLAVNVSMVQFRQPDFVDQVVAAIKQSGANPQRLKLELTESLFADSVQDIIVKINSLKALGICFSLDDFGTGYSSLAYLSRLPLDQLKIDRSFVMNLEFNETDVAICAATINLAHSLKLKVVAEGVETEAQRYFLSTVHRCELLQAYLFSRPLPLADFELLVVAGGT